MKIVVATGASGGHIYPALSVIDEWHRRHADDQIILVVPQKKFIADLGSVPARIVYLAIDSIPAGPNRRTIVSLLNFLKSSLQCLFLIAGIRPDAVVGFGSVASIPVVVCAWLFRIPTVIHEQNVSPGKANRMLAVFVDKIAVSFAESKDYFMAARRKIVFTGNPLRTDFVHIQRPAAAAYFGLADNVFTVLATGGSQGSTRINALVSEAIAGLNGRYAIQVIHLTGFKDYEKTKKSYAALSPRAVVMPFLKEMHVAYSAADIVIARSGATTISEIIYFGIPAVLIPYPYASGHQAINAGVLARQGCAVIMADKDVTPGALGNTLAHYIAHPRALERMRNSFRAHDPVNAAGLVVGAVRAVMH
jgi:UDP-N-acetylglucosamine--N-acetylmuramyl-(pentapeptide) pyrophosphoryl-undecaprenol N-acetylglucosamine transferase